MRDIADRKNGIQGAPQRKAVFKIMVGEGGIFRLLRRSFSTHGTKEAHPTEMQAQLWHSDPRMTLNTYPRTLGPEVIQMVNQVTNRILGLAEKGEEAVQVNRPRQ